MYPRILSLLVLLSLPGRAAQKEKTHELNADVIVYGDASVGVSAVVQAARMGKSVILVSQYGHMGGLTSSGLGYTDIGNRKILGGISREFYHRVYLHYKNESAWVRQKKEDFPKHGQGAPAFDDKTELGSVFEPKMAERIFDKMVAEAGVKVVKARLDLEKDALMDGRKITAIWLENGTKIQGKMFIDATYEGDLMAAAKVTFTVGREANAKYKEVSNAITLPVHSNNLPDEIDPYRIKGDPDSGLLPGVNPYDEAGVGKGDHRLQAFCYRMCLTNASDNLVPIPKPDGYDEADYEILFRALDAGHRGQWGQFYKFSAMPNRKTDPNNNGGISTDFIGRNYSPLPPADPGYWDWTTLSHSGREALAAKHRDWQLGLVWTLQNHPRVPEDVRQKYSGWGLPKDEFTDNGHWPYNLYVREGRRMVSNFVMTEHQCRQDPDYPQVTDSVGMGAYTMDSHHVQRVIWKGQLKNEGDIQMSLGGKPYPISYRSIVPAKGECENLLVPWCLSSSHIAFGSIRMDGKADAIGAGNGRGMRERKRLNPVIWKQGEEVAGAAGSNIDGKKDNIVILKFEFGKTDKVSTWHFTEDQQLTEDAFNQNAASCSAAIDEDTLDVLTVCTILNQNAIDEIRIGTDFKSVISGTIPPRQEVKITKTQYDAKSDRYHLEWSSNPGEVYGLYVEMLGNAREVLSNLGNEFPEWKGRGYQIVGFAWHQGTSDKAPDKVAEEYKHNLPDFIASVRSEFGKPNLPFVIGTTGMGYDTGTSPPPYENYHAVEKAQLWVSGIDKPSNVLTDDTRGYFEPPEKSPRNQGFHWHGNARSYFRVGLGLGNNMVTLLGK